MRFWASHMCTFLDVYFAAVKKIKNEALNTNSYQAMTEEYFFFNLKFLFYCEKKYKIYP